MIGCPRHGWILGIQILQQISLQYQHNIAIAILEAGGVEQQFKEILWLICIRAQVSS